MIRRLNLINKYNQASAIVEANIALLEREGYYTVILRNGQQVRNVPGSSGLKVGASVALSSYGGRFIIIGSSYKNVESVISVSV
jgi:hypothetical protein